VPTFTIEPVSATELDTILTGLIEAGGKVDRIKMATSLLMQQFADEGDRVVRAQVRGKSAEYPELAGDFNAEAAWHLHDFADQVQRVAGGIRLPIRLDRKGMGAGELKGRPEE
jgi:hypothetical protein